VERLLCSEEERNPVSANRLNESRIERVFIPESVTPVGDLSLSLWRLLIFTPVPDKKKDKKKRELRK
jgi:hypothetical protein